MLPKRLQQTWQHWRRGIRVYIALAIVLVTLQAWWWAAVSYGGSTLFATRLEEVYAWLSLGLLILAISIGPFYSIWRGAPGLAMMSDARRLIGVGAGWFALLHVSITYIALFKAANPFQLPIAYRQSFAVGSIALLILMAMVGTSFDKAFHGLGIWWFRLHRLIYAALLLILLHIFMIGVHATEWPALILLTILATALLLMHGYLAFVRPARPTIWQLLAVSYTALLLIALFNYGYGQKLGYNLLTLAMPTASAHVLKQDSGISGVLHIPPEDNPPAGVPVRLGVSFADTKNAFSLKNCDCQMVIQLNRKVVKTLPLKPYFSGSTLNGLVTTSFPKVGVYQLIVKGTSTDGSFSPFQLEYLVRVASSANGSVSPEMNSDGTSILIISAGSLIILVLFAQIAIKSGLRYKPQSPKKGKTINKRKR